MSNRHFPVTSIVDTICNVISAQRPFWRSLRLQGTYDDSKSEASKKIRHVPTIEYKGTLSHQKPETYPTREWYNTHTPERKQELEDRIETLIRTTSLDFPKQRTCLAYDKAMENHQSIFEKNHIETPERLSLSYKKLQDLRLYERCYTLKSRYATEEELRLAHGDDIIMKIKATETMTRRELAQTTIEFPFTYVCENSYKSALLSSGCLLEAVDSVLSRETLNGFALIRPPGHHADHSQPGGLCLFNNVAIAAKYAITRHSLERILIVDWDVHHGNGTQNLFYDDPRVLYVSLHRYEHGNFYPFLRESDYTSTGVKRGYGYNINIPWNDVENNDGMKDEDYLAAFFNIIMPVAYEFNPELVIVSSGFDSGEGDPIGRCRVTPECYGQMTNLLSSLAGGKIIVALEGGYNVNTVAEGVANCVSVLLGDSCKSLHPFLHPSNSAMNTIRDVIGVHKQFWSCLKFDVDLPSYEEVTSAIYTSELKSTSQFGSSITQREKIERPNILPEWCWHLQLLNAMKCSIDPAQGCVQCSEMYQNWLCLHCFQVYCSGNVKGHMAQHAKELGHSLCISYSDLKVWCYGCDSYIDNMAFFPIQKHLYLQRHKKELEYPL